MALVIPTVVEEEKVNPVAKALMDVVTVRDNNSEMKNMIENLDALNKEVGQHKHEEYQQDLQPNISQVNFSVQAYLDPTGNNIKQFLQFGPLPSAK